MPISCLSHKFGTFRIFTYIHNFPTSIVVVFQSGDSLMGSFSRRCDHQSCEMEGEGKSQSISDSSLMLRGISGLLSRSCSIFLGLVCSEVQFDQAGEKYLVGSHIALEFLCCCRLFNVGWCFQIVLTLCAAIYLHQLHISHIFL
uniref:Uncharacterized protein n=1 Tax=Parascaris univalens TaxID=6257 RepID=A0A915B7H9_PARUN